MGFEFELMLSFPRALGGNPAGRHTSLPQQIILASAGMPVVTLNARGRECDYVGYET
jgi:hypothetical protein